MPKRSIRDVLNDCPTVILSVVASVCLLWVTEVCAKDYARVEIADPYIELHTGPGRGFPIYHVVDRHETVEVLKRKTDWFKVRSASGKEGWVYLAQMNNTFSTPEVKKQLGNLVFKHYKDRTGEFGVSTGDFEGATLVSLYTGFSLNQNLFVEFAAGSAAGELTETQLLTAGIQSSPFPDWKVSPYFTLGFGKFINKPRKNLAFLAKREEDLANAGFGVRYYMTRRLLLTVAVRHHVVFVDRDESGEFLEWKAGVSIFY